LFVLSILATLVFPILAFSDEGEVSEIYLKEKVPISEILDVAKIFNVELVGIYSEFTTNDSKYIDFVNTEGLTDANSIIKKLIEKRQVLKEVSIEGYKIAIGKGSFENKMLEEAKKNIEALNKADITTTKITRIFVNGDKASIDRLAQKIKAMQVVNFKSRENCPTCSKEKNISQESLEPKVSCPGTPPSPNTWAPKAGYIDTYQLGNGNRAAYNAVYWNVKSGFGGIFNAYEHDFFTNNDDDKYYFTKAETYLSFPKTEYWASTLPNPYLDSRYGDNRDELAYTIGSCSMNQISLYHWYNTYMELKPGNYSTDTGKLQAQLQCVGPVCYSLDITAASTINLISAWNISIPGFKNWSR
jgi:hypothetical protein